VTRLGAADIDGDARRLELALRARDQPGAGGIEGGQVGQDDQHLLGPCRRQRPQLLVERPDCLDRPGAGGGKNDVLPPPLGFHQPSRHRLHSSFPPTCVTCRAGSEIARPARTR
jgi:hypothetical protein